MIRFMIHSWPYDTFHNTFLVLGLKAETYNFGLSSGAQHSTCYCCLSSNHAQWLHQWRPLRSFHVLSFCIEYARFIGIYLLLFVGVSHSFLTIVRDRTASYCIFISLSVSWYVSSAQIYQYIENMMNRFTPNKYNYKFIQENGVLNYQYKYLFSFDSNTNTSIQIQIQKTLNQIYLPKFTPLHFRKFHWHWSSCGTWWGRLACCVGMRSTVRWLETPYK